MRSPNMGGAHTRVTEGVRAKSGIVSVYTLGLRRIVGSGSASRCEESQCHSTAQ